MKYINAGIKSKKELAQRLIDGEAIYTPYFKLITFDEDKFEQPFTVGDNTLNATWRDFAECQLLAKWQDDIGDGVFCWVSDYDENEKSKVRLILSYNPAATYAYYAQSGAPYMYATPLTKEEALNYVA